mgnify:CR=1 FL=1
MPNSTLQAASDLNLGLFAFKMAGGLLVLLGLIFLGLYLLKRYGPKAGLRFAGQNKLQLVERISIGTKKSVIVVRFLNRDLVLGVTENNINLLSEAETAHDQTPQKNFFQLLDQSMASHSTGHSRTNINPNSDTGSR